MCSPRSVIAAVTSVWLAVFAVVAPVRGVCAPAARYLQGFVVTNGVQLEYLDWGGTGPALILLHGLADNPQVFADLAPAFTDRFHVIAYARRGSGGSQAQAPYDVATLTEDLRGLMDALGIGTATLVGWSAGGDEITEMAARHPQRVERIVYFDSGYDWSDPDFAAAVAALPLGFFDPPANATVSLDAFRSYLKAQMFPSLDDVGRVEANLRAKVVIQADGSVKNRTTHEVVDALYAAIFSNTPRRYAQVRCPALAIYASHLYDLSIADRKRREDLIAYERRYWLPFQEKSRARLRRELANVEMMRVPGAHVSFIFTERQTVIDAVRRFVASR